MSSKPHVMFIFWGRRGSLTQFTLEVARAAIGHPKFSATISVSRQNESYQSFAALGESIYPVDTFSTGAGALSHSWRVPILRNQLHRLIQDEGVDAIIELMPHIWSPLVMPVVRKAGARYCPVIHDARAHPGDYTAWATPVLGKTVRFADTVITLSNAVASQLVDSGLVAPNKVRTLFHPDLSYAPMQERRTPPPLGPFRLLFLGRIMAYKGLPLFLDMIEHLRGEGIAVDAGVYGDGSLGASAERIQRLGITLANRWLTDDEITMVLPQYDAMVLSYVEASQSGVAATAYGSGMPVIATPVGGLTQQVINGVTGVIAERVDAPALAAAAKRLLMDDVFYRSACANIRRMREDRSVKRFVDQIVEIALE